MADNNKGFSSPNYDENTAEEARQEGGDVSSSEQDMSKLGQKGGEAAQKSGDTHELTDAERKEGGKTSSSEQDMSKLGKMGGNK
jgi:hypothetical protein